MAAGIEHIEIELEATMGGEDSQDGTEKPLTKDSKDFFISLAQHELGNTLSSILVLIFNLNDASLGVDEYFSNIHACITEYKEEYNNRFLPWIGNLIKLVEKTGNDKEVSKAAISMVKRNLSSMQVETFVSYINAIVEEAESLKPILGDIINLAISNHGRQTSQESIKKYLNNYNNPRRRQEDDALLRKRIQKLIENRQNYMEKWNQLIINWSYTEPILQFLLKGENERLLFSNHPENPIEDILEQLESSNRIIRDIDEWLKDSRDIERLTSYFQITKEELQRMVRINVSPSSPINIALIQFILENFTRNAVDHAYDPGKEGPVFVSIIGDAESLVIKVADLGNGGGVGVDVTQKPTEKRNSGNRGKGIGIKAINYLKDELDKRFGAGAAKVRTQFTAPNAQRGTTAIFTINLKSMTSENIS